jgi:Ca2+ transporting ATPase
LEAQTWQGDHALWKNFHAKGGHCDIFHHDTASTVSLSILVTIEMFNALNALSENQSLLSVGFSNKWVVLACLLSFALHIMLLHVPFFNNVFHVTSLNTEEWTWVMYWSLPVFLIDEVLKFISRRLPEPPLVKVAGDRAEKKKLHKKKKEDAAKKHD